MRGTGWSVRARLLAAGLVGVVVASSGSAAAAAGVEEPAVVAVPAADSVSKGSTAEGTADDGVAPVVMTQRVGRAAEVMPAGEFPRGEYVAAWQRARESGRAQDVSGWESETDSYVVNPDGSVTVTMSSGPVRVREGDRFVPVDTELVVDGAAVRPRA